MTRFCSILLLLIFSVSTAYAQDQTQAISEAQTFVNLLDQHKYKEVWQDHVGDLVKKSVTEDYFISYHTMGRATIGSLKDSKLVGVDVSTTDPTTGYTGTIYAVTFLNKYDRGNLYERVVVYLDGSDFKMGGYFVTQAQ